MEGESFDIREGMTVFGSDGEKMGKIVHIFSAAPRRDLTADAADRDNPGNVTDADTAPDVQPQPEPLNRPPSGFFEPGAGTTVSNPNPNIAYGASLEGDYGNAGSDQTEAATLTPSDTKYLSVRHGGVLGIGGDLIYVPFSAVQAVNPGESVTLRSTSAESAVLFEEKPGEIVDEPPA